MRGTLDTLKLGVKYELHRVGEEYVIVRSQRTEFARCDSREAARQWMLDTEAERKASDDA